MKFGAIDIGTNAARLLIGEVVNKKGRKIVKKISYTRIPLRLGIEVFENKKIGNKKKIEFLKTIQAFKLISEVFEVRNLKAVATSAMREASNSKEIQNEIYKASSINIEVIDGNEEAKLIFNSFLNLKSNNNLNSFLVIDVGGGSTEISIFNKGIREESKSFKIGTIRLLKNKVTQKSWKDLDNWIDEQQNKIKKLEVFATGGNINKIHKILGYRYMEPLPVSEIESLNKKLNSFSFEEMVDKMGLKEDRADVIIPALKIYLKIMKRLNTNEVIVPKVGLSDGIIIDLFNKYNN